MKFNSDIDIDFANRQHILSNIKHVVASIDDATGHNTGIYVTQIPTNHIENRASIDYKIAEQRGYIKLDLLNVNVYNQIKNEQELLELMCLQPPWQKLHDESFCKQLIHIGNHYDTLLKMPVPVTNIEELAMFLAIIRPSKRHLIGKTWVEIKKTIWEIPQDGYYFKRSHSVAYAHLIVVHMNLLDRFSN